MLPHGGEDGHPIHTNIQLPIPLGPPHVPDENPTGDYSRGFHLDGWISEKALLHFDGDGLGQKGTGAMRILVTGSADGLGRLAAESLVKAGHKVVAHVRSEDRVGAVRKLTDLGAELVVGDLGSLEQTLDVALQANKIGRMNAVIHNAGVSSGPHLAAVNVVAPYLLTASLSRPDRLVYLSSGNHLSGRMFTSPPEWSRSSLSYSDSKLFLTTLALAIARLWPDVLSNAVNPGWVPTRMGGPSATDGLSLGHHTQEWLATSFHPAALTSGGYWHHQLREQPHAATLDESFQNRLLNYLAEHTGVSLNR